MDLTHRFSVPAGVDEAWAAFNDLERLAPCFPGATITGVEGDDFTGTVKVKLGPIALLYGGSGRYAERDDAAHRVRIEARGKDKRGNGTATATVTASFSGNGERTDVEVQTDLAITGKPAQFGRGVISDVSDKLLEQFVTCISGRFAEPDEVTEPSAEEQVEPEPTPVPDSEPAPASATPAPPAAPAAAPREGPPPPADLNMLSTVGPVLLKRYGPIVAVVGLLLFVMIKIIRRRSATGLASIR